MKRTWELDELSEFFTLGNKGALLWNGKDEAGQVGLATLLKFFQYEGRFPYYPAEVPTQVVEFIAGQLGISAEQYATYDQQGRRSKRDRVLIREYLYFQEASLEDLETLSRWIASHPDGLQEIEEEYWLRVARDYLKEHRFEPPTGEHLRRIVRSGLYQQEENWYESTYGEAE